MEEWAKNITVDASARRAVRPRLTIFAVGRFRGFASVFTFPLSWPWGFPAAFFYLCEITVEHRVSTA
jgi:hypothetical protein